jgi:transcriptional regulator with XRE-family HTH domain
MAALQGEPPAVARQRVRRALRQARGETPLSQTDVARKLGWSLSKMQRIEGGDVAVSLTDLRALLDVYGMTDAAEVARLTDDARASRRQRWVTPPEHRAYLTPALRQLIQFETQAVGVRAYQPMLIPGTLQTPAVADIILSSKSNRISGEERRVRYEFRMERRRRTFEDTAGPRYLLILDESVIKRHIGGAKVMAEQLRSLVEVAQRPNVKIRVVPLNKGALLGLVAPFQKLDLSEDNDDSVVYREWWDRDEIVHDPAEVRYVTEIFEELWAASLTEEATVSAIEAEAAALEAEVLRAPHLVG